MDIFWQLFIALAPIVAGVIFYFFVVKRDLVLLQKDISLIQKDVGKIEGIEEYIKDLSHYLHDGRYDVPERLKSYMSRVSPYYMSHSPVRLTEKGNSLIRESWFQEILDAEKDFFVKNIRQKLDEKGESDTFFYFAEKYSVDLIRDFYEWEDRILDPIRQYIFEQGLIDDKDRIITTLGIALRDAVIHEYWKEQAFSALFEEWKEETATPRE